MQVKRPRVTGRYRNDNQELPNLLSHLNNEETVSKTDFRPNKFNRANLQQQYDKYVNLARESLSGGDRVSSESYYQQAEFYLRMLNERQQEQRQHQQRQAPVVQPAPVIAVQGEPTNESTALQPPTTRNSSASTNHSPKQKPSAPEPMAPVESTASV